MDSPSVLLSLSTYPFFSVIVNGAMHGFFKNYRGLRQGDPLSPSLFIISEEVLSRGLSRLFSHNLVGYYRHGRGQIPITHLLFADDMLIFFNVSKKYLENLFKFLGSYEASSGQLINKGKSALYLSKKISYAKNLSSKTSLVSLNKRKRISVQIFLGSHYQR